MQNTIFGKIIKYYRKAARLTREECAECCHVSKTHISRIERGVLQPKFITVVHLCNICGIDIRTLYEIYYPDSE